MQRAIILIDGYVQRVGYRYKVSYIARKYRLKGRISNLEDGRVEITVEGNKEAIESFIDDINIKDYPIYVEDIDVRYEEATAEFKTFKIITDSLEEEMIEGFGTGAIYLDGIKNELREFRSETRDNFNDLKKIFNDNKGVERV